MVDIYPPESDGCDEWFRCDETPTPEAPAAQAAAWVLDERMLTLRKCIASAKAEGWQNMAIETLESLTGGAVPEQKP
jgi:hypothetical protein